MNDTARPRREWIRVLVATVALALGAWLGCGLLGVIGLGQGLGALGALAGGHDAIGGTALGQLDIAVCTRLLAAAQVAVSGWAGWKVGPAERQGARAAVGLLGGLLVGPGGLFLLDALVG